MKRVTPNEFLVYQRAAIKRFAKKTGREPTPRQLSYWSRSFQITRPTTMVSRVAKEAIQKRLAWQYRRKTGRLPSQAQLSNWTKGFKVKQTGIPVAPRLQVADMTKRRAGDKYRFTYEVGGYIGGNKKYKEIRLVRYGPEPDSWDADDMEELVPRVYYAGGFADPSFGVDEL